MRAHLQDQVRNLVAPLVPHFSVGGARVRLGVNTAIHDDTAAELESFARPLWGLAPLAAGKGAVPHAELRLRGLAHGSDPGHGEYWGEPRDRDQRIVEMAAIGFALALAPEQWWDPLSGRERDRLARWLCAALQRETADNNWHFFPVLIGLGLGRVGVPYDRSLVTARLTRLESFWLGDGWYSDGPTERRDYYVPWAMHFYGLLYDTLTGLRDLDDGREGEIVDCLPGTNVLARRTALPMLTGQLPPGAHWLRCAVLGAPDGPEAEEAWRQPPDPPTNPPESSMRGGGT
ncbi:DUF2264 domain-containing protein [Streptomyces yerevanensis]|uniref:DUF2264 domain-containing protein n=1 Tax=Streptomyces yerevanensis TaxID=66378 RepID=UPI000996C82A|nr:DUF2264 domain-containing protein [Streptomyces yerevanensis]